MRFTPATASVSGAGKLAWSRTSRHARGYGTAWDKLRKRILERDKYLCQGCLAKQRITPATEVNHKTPKAQGGTDDEANLEAICHPCHVDETARQAGKTVKPETGVDGWPTR